MSLFSNAIQFADTGSVIVSGSAGPDTLIIESPNTGVGITEADQTQILERFKPAKYHRSSYGLGLPFDDSLAPICSPKSGSDLAVVARRKVQG
ncbi:MAG: HAMP domain-containing histidine kinase [Acaryochloridaceae cyanobacterium SU_2_1]|nr:HAMP domain-containing histidine kinase [Acaryochloridaceae cyanobacterium SU_2_1]